MGLLNLIFKQLGNTFKLIILVAKTAKMGRFNKTPLKKAKTSKSKSKTKSKGLKSTFLKNTKLISTKYKKLKSRFLVGRRQLTGLIWKSPIALFVMIAVVLGLSGALAWYKVTFVTNPPLYTLDQDHPIQADVQHSTSALPPEYAELIDLNLESQPEPESEALVMAKDKEPVIKTAPPLTQLQPYLAEGQSSALIKTINPHFLVEVPPTETQRVSIVLTGLGINKQLTENVIDELQASDQVTLVFSPYADRIGEQIFYARHEGYKTLLTLPMEDDNLKTDQGFLTLRTKKSVEANLQNLTVLFNLARECEGFYGEGGNRLLRSPADLEPFVEWVTKNKNFFLAPPDVLMNRLHEIGSKIKLNYACTTLVDPDLSKSPLVSSLAKRTGFAVLAFKIKPNIVEEINEWIINLEKDNISIVPITEIIPIRDKR